ncbi:PR domain zinc finger protein 15 [Patella vulgata]|uniref:PR domain zinc finger protein 15 n=1 Tax=Patella vulgata TaxID=6465 RepID=UPI00217F277E|nr:PR domain zinc finger protein 15 [Patella vulgata]XP_050391134.1 PR domain zinc finger protein 15 [Patella vulgata]XP_050391219.1 PR domain zinc finger protein 15 [Patella vulgata]XP_050391265.1 PR domain zinc finger protein 15 [Patella vulgata]
MASPEAETTEDTTTAVVAVECDVCGGEHQTEYCPELGLADPGTVIEFVSRARLTLPDTMQIIEMADGSLGVSSKVVVPQKTQLGPFEAKRTNCDIEAMDFFILKMFNKDGSITCFDASDENECNWMCLIRPADSVYNQNCMAYTINHNVFYSTTCVIRPDEELRVWYAPHYAKKLGRDAKPNGTTRTMLGALLVTEQPEFPIKTEPVDGDPPEVKLEARHTCQTCYKSFSNDSDFAKHIRSHIIPERSLRGPYKCKKCPSRFKNVGKLREHMANHNKKHICLFCDKKFASNHVLKQHIILKHSDTSTKPGGSKEIVSEDPHKHSDSPTKTTEGSNEIISPGRQKFAPPMKDILPQSVPDSDVQEAAESIMSLRKAAEATKTDPGVATKDSDVELEQFIPKLAEDAPSVLNTDTKDDDGDDPGNDFDNENNSTVPSPTSADVSNTSTAAAGVTEDPMDESKQAGENEVTEINENQLNLTSEDTPIPVEDNRSNQLTDDTPKTSTKRGPGRPRKSKTTSLEIEKMTRKRSPPPVKTFIPSANRSPQPTVKTKASIPIRKRSPQPVIRTSAPTPLRVLPRRANRGIRTTGKFADESDEDASPKKSRTPHGEKKGRGRPRKSEIEPTSKAEEQKNEEDDDVDDDVDDDEEEEEGDEFEYMDDEDDDMDFKPSRNEQADDDHYISDSPSRGRKRKLRKYGEEPKRRIRIDKDEEILALEALTVITEDDDGEKLYKCGKCGKKFTQQSYLRLHLPAHTDRYKCGDCGKRFTRNESFQKHQCQKTEQVYFMKERVNEDDPNIYCCAQCKKEFTQLDFVIKHFALHSESQKCPRCGKVFPVEEEYNKHMETVCEDPVEFEYSCDICKQTFKNEKYLYRHMAVHTDLHKCDKCGKCYSRKDSWQTHILRCMPETVDDLQIFVCTNCKKTFATQLGANNHMVNCAKHCCSECKTAFQSEEELKIHECLGSEASKNITIQFQCTKCNKNFSSITYLNRHEASHQGAFDCDICHKQFSRKEEHSMHHRFCLANHLIQENGQIECEICTQIFRDSKEYRDHYHSHTHPHYCTACHKRFIKVGTLHNHKCEPIYFDTTGQFLSCEQCQKKFRSEKNLIRHQVIHGTPQFKCDSCQRQFFRKDYLADHVCSLPDGTKMRIVRKKNKVQIRENLVCHLCGRPFTSSSNLNKHMRIHGEKKYECPICFKRFHFENYVKLHTEMVHEKKFRYQCSYCGKVVTSKAGLMCHIRQFHTTNAPTYKCPTCGKVFRQSGNLKTHMFSHDKEKKFQCSLCPRSFKYPEQMRRHKLEHTMVDKYTCEICDKKFVRAYELKRHNQNFHSGIVYVCALCSERCGHRHTMIRHFKRKHPHNMDLVRNSVSLDDMRRQGEVVEVKQEQQETTILLETVQQLENTLSGNSTAEIILPDNLAAEALQDLSNAVISTNSLGQETITIPSSIQSSIDGIETADGEQTVVILQIINPEDQEEVAEEVVGSMEFIEQEAIEEHENVMETVEIQPEGVSIDDIHVIEEQ